MKKLTAISLALVAFFFAFTLNAQEKKQSQWSGVPCSDCTSAEASQKGSPNTVQNGNGTIATSVLRIYVGGLS